MIKMTLPGITEFSDINLLFLSFYRDARDIFLDDVTLDSVYGGFFGSRLCGGRNSFGARMPLDEVERLIGRYNSLGVACNATFTNQFVDVELIASDEYGRDLLALLASANTDIANGIILHSDTLDEYVRAEFSALTRISSTTKELDSVRATNVELECFDRVVLNYNFTKDEGVIQEIDYRERLEVMANEYCSLNCPYRKEHYAQTSYDQLRGKPSGFLCKHTPEPQAFSFLAGLIEGSVFLKNADICRYAADYGIRYFKIVGRGLARYDIIDSYLYYLVKPEHWYEVRDYLIHRNYL